MTPRRLPPQARVTHEHDLIIARVQRAFRVLTPIEGLELCVRVIESVRELREGIRR